MTLAAEKPQAIETPVFNYPEVIAALQQLNTIESIELYLKEITDGKGINDITPISKDVRAAVRSGLIKTPDHLLVPYQGRNYKGRKQESQDLAQKPVYVGLAFLWGLSSSLNAAAAEKKGGRAAGQVAPDAADTPPREQKPLDAVELHDLAVRYIHEPITADDHAWERKSIACCFLAGRRIVEILEISNFSAAGLYLMDLRDVAKGRGKSKRGVIPVLYDADLLANAITQIRSHLAKNRTEALQKYHEMGGRKNPVAVRQLSSNVGGSVRRSHDKEARKLLEGCAEEGSENKEALHGLRRAYACIMLESRGLLSHVSMKQQLEFVQNQLMHDEAATTLEYMEFIPTRVDELLARLGKPFKMEMEHGVKRHVSIHARKFMFEVFLSALDNEENVQLFREMLESSAADSGSFEVNLARKINVATEKRAEQVQNQKPKASGADRTRIIIDCLMDWNEKQQGCVPDRSCYISSGIIRRISAKHSTGITPPTIKQVLDEYSEALKTHHEGLGLSRETNDGLKGRMDELVELFVQEYADRL